jgi:Putative  PD-(D/E)XK family member, (DUF4420)
LHINDDAPRAAPIHLEHLAIEHNTHCTITIDATQQDGHFTILRCHNAPHELEHVFFRVAAPLVEELPAEPTQATVNQVVTAFIDLFRAITRPAHATLQGLWAELFLIAKGTNPALLITAWRSTAHDRYDFASGQERLDVKSSGTRVRQHHFSLEQLTPPAGTRAIIASLFAELSASGPSITDLIDQITARVPPALQARLQQLALTALGNTWREADTARFDRELAAASLRFFDSASVPSICPPIPSSVTEVRFRADLTNATSLSRQECQTLGLLAAASNNFPR